MRSTGFANWVKLGICLLAAVHCSGATAADVDSGVIERSGSLDRSALRRPAILCFGSDGVDVPHIR